MKTSTIAWVVIIILIIIGGAWYFMSANGSLMPAPGTDNTSLTGSDNIPNDTDLGSTTTNTVTVLYSTSGFSPSTITIKQGDTVTFTNNGGGEMWIASAPHPTHQAYDGTTEAQHCASGYTGPAPFDQCGAGTTFSFKFDKVGTFTYHNHDNSSKFGSVVVQ